MNPANKFRHAPMRPAAEEHRHLMNVMLDTSPQVDVALPPEQHPTNPQTGSSSVVQVFLLDDAKTGVLALGSFSGDSFANLQNNLLTGLQNLKDKGATQLIVDISNNSGGYIYVARAHIRTFSSASLLVFFRERENCLQWLHRIIAVPKSTTEPQAALDTETRAGPLAQLIVQTAAQNSSMMMTRT